MKGINPSLDGMCQNELCLEGISEPAQKCWPDKHNTKFGIFLFFFSPNVFKELRITAFELSGFRSHASGGN